MSLRTGVSVPMDADAIHPEAIVAAVTMGIKTLQDRTSALGQVLNWDTTEIHLQRPGSKEVSADLHDGGPLALLVVRAEVLR